MVESVLDDVPGLGEARRKALLKHFGSVKRLRAATVEEIAEVPGIGPRYGSDRRIVAEALDDRRASTATGECRHRPTGEILVSDAGP